MPAGDAITTVEIRQYRNLLAGFKTRRSVCFDKFSGKFMAEDAGILKEGLNALIGMEIRAANTDVAYPNDGVILLQRRTITQAIFEIPRFGAG